MNVVFSTAIYINCVISSIIFQVMLFYYFFIMTCIKCAISLIVFFSKCVILLFVFFLKKTMLISECLFFYYSLFLKLLFVKKNIKLMLFSEN